MIGIYCIEHVASGKKYIGKSINIKHRFSVHKWYLQKSPKPKDCNRYLYNAVQKYSIKAFKMYPLELFTVCDEVIMREREIYWMDFYKTCEREFGYNLRRDSSTKMIVSEETVSLMKEVFKGEKNPNFGNRWNEQQKRKMSDNVKLRHKNGKYNETWRNKISKKSIELWKNENKKRQMALNVSKAKEKYIFLQYKNGWLIRVWKNIKEIIENNPGYKWQNIYSVCNGYKHTYMGFVWKKELKNTTCWI